VKLGDLVKFRTEGVLTMGILLEIKDNPADLDWLSKLSDRAPRKLACIMCDTLIYTTWLTHVEIINETR
jgi:hypothetical protein